jgi:imidazolonepropionase-like amidohydrolase
MEKYQAERVYDDPRLRKWTPLEVLQAGSYRLQPYITDEAEFHHRAVAQQAAKLQRAGVNVALGAHGQVQGLGVHWELEMLGGPGAMTPYRALQAATIAGARHLGLDQDIGSIRAGKVADLFVVDGDPLTDLKAARNVVYVAKDGVLYDAAGNMDTAWPSPKQRPPMTWELTTPQ